ncbi:hypothetical protein ACN4DI_01870 [Corynebacterium macclintockiae]|uniref:hypothetical protein n=1 Tax=Corynebacterium macclintockiae TaxID=2913501 RepID=UPI003EBC1CBD
MPADLPTTLRHLAHHLHHLQTEIWENRYHAARTSQTGVRHTTTGPSSPTNDTQLTYLTETQTRLRELATNTSEDLHLLIPHNTQVGNYWAAWFYRHHTQLQDLTWYTDLTEELTDLEAELRHHIHPQDPNLHIEQRQSARSICARLANMGHRIQPATIRQWHKRGKITAVERADGTNGYLLSEVLEAI